MPLQIVTNAFNASACCSSCTLTRGCFSWTHDRNASVCLLYRDSVIGVDLNDPANLDFFDIDYAPGFTTGFAYPEPYENREDNYDLYYCSRLVAVPYQTSANPGYWFETFPCQSTVTVACRRPTPMDSSALTEEERNAITQYMEPVASFFTSGGLTELSLYDAFLDRPSAEAMCGLLGGSLVDASKDDVYVDVTNLGLEAMFAQPTLFATVTVTPGISLVVDNSTQRSEFHVNLRGRPGGFSWGSGVVENRGLWAPGEPDSSPLEPVVSRPMCQRPVAASRLGVSLRTIPPSAQTLQGSAHFMLYTRLMDWPTARVMCKAQGGDLAFFDSPAQYEQVTDMVFSWMRGNPHLATNFSTWFGLNDRVAEGDFRWAGQPWLPSPTWARWASNARSTDEAVLIAEAATSFGELASLAACPPGTYVTGIQARVDRRVFTAPAATDTSEDGLGVINIRMQCGNSTTVNVATIQSGEDPTTSLGPWSDPASVMRSCTGTGNYAVGVAIKSLDPQDITVQNKRRVCYKTGECKTFFDPVTTNSDDFGATSIQLLCRTGGAVEISNANPSPGNWSRPTMCDTGFFMCGFAVSSQQYRAGITRYHTYTDYYDNTAVNSLQIRCCRESIVNNTQDCGEIRYTLPSNSTKGSAAWVDQPCKTTRTQISANFVLCRRELSSTASQGVAIVKKDGVSERGAGLLAVTVPTIADPVLPTVVQAASPVALEVFNYTTTVSSEDELSFWFVPMPWALASSWCKAHSSELASLTDSVQVLAASKLVQRWLERYEVNQVNPANELSVWFGASNAGSRAPWRYTSGDAVQYSAWGAQSKEPRLASCGELKFLTSGAVFPVWIASPCNRHLPFICRRSSSRRPAPVLGAPPSASMTLYSSRTTLFNQDMTWDSAKGFCEQRGGVLASVNSESEAYLMVDMVQEWARSRLATGTVRIWLGSKFMPTANAPAADADGETTTPAAGSWSWLDKTEFNYLRYQQSLPTTSSPVELCLVWNILVYPDQRPQTALPDKWEAVPCTQIAYPMCQADLQPFICQDPNPGIIPNPELGGDEVFCPPGTVLTGIQGAIPASSQAVAERSISFAGICGNPSAPAALGSRDRDSKPTCRYDWSLPRQQGLRGWRVRGTVQSRIDQCIELCGLDSARMQEAYASPKLAVLFKSTNSSSAYAPTDAVDSGCYCAVAYNGLALGVQALQDAMMPTAGNDVILDFGTQRSIEAVCAFSVEALSTLTTLPTQFRLELPDLGYVPVLTSIVRDSKYRVFTQGADWNAAQRVCTLNGGHLAVLESAQDIRDLVNLIQSVGNMRFPVGMGLWLGLFLAQSPQYRWVDGTPLTYNITIGEEWDYSPTNCGALSLTGTTQSTYTGTVSTRGCDNMLAFVCETSTIVDDSLAGITPGVTQAVTGLGQGLGSWSVTLYTAHMVSWLDAQRICRYEGQELVWFFTQAEQQWLTQRLQSSTTLAVGVWTGLSSDAGGRMAWRSSKLSDARAMELSTWQLPRGISNDTESLDRNGGVCGALVRPSPTQPYQMTLVSCDTPLAFVCKTGQRWVGPNPTNKTSYPPPPPPSPVAAVGTPVADSEFTIRGQRYLYFQGKGDAAVNWTTAERRCAAIGGRLAEFASKDDFFNAGYAVKDFWLGYTSDKYKSFWFGLRKDPDDLLTYRYASGNVPAASAVAWGPDEPRSSVSELESRQSGRLWVNRPSECVEGQAHLTPRSYIVEKRIELLLKLGFIQVRVEDHKIKIKALPIPPFLIFWLIGLEQAWTQEWARIRNTWNVQSCSARNAYMCMVTPPPLVINSLAVNQDIENLDFQITYQGTRYVMYASVMGWSEAAGFCAGNGQVLADFSSESEYDYVRQGLAQWVYTDPNFAEEVINVWVGYQSRTSDVSGNTQFTVSSIPISGGGYYAPLTSAFTATNQCAGLTINPKSQAVSMNPSVCTRLMRPLCRSDRSAAKPALEITVNGRRFAYFPQARSWGRARETCQTLFQGDLATFGTSAEYDAVKAWMNSVFYNGIVMGTKTYEMSGDIYITDTWFGMTDLYTLGWAYLGSNVGNETNNINWQTRPAPTNNPTAGAPGPIPARSL
ncbi:hypothetical protein HYH03_013526 [Edaphochlamys debaryana]|uniref:C-type lectin domain-containing protein n=1 Tax=Edaphochlamys debaryana TaxID=47281 RepID=A0A836BTB7_9CHLO|nr:hypothetical protein HYH03_013526 [Edaphochlamys debaryana]|eukprot:KAG2487947.1 hypothetical protein HYH03_013526 [Edaphochlamys debaryana]